MINWVEMVNWRAYDQRTVEFAPGINFLMGANGMGKTSILEAIVFALTGESSTVIKRGKLLRDPSQPARVRLALMVEGEEYEVQRTLTLERVGSAELKCGAKTLASGPARVTNHIERLTGVSAEFLRRIVYMAEGDVFRFLDKPPGEAINDQIRRVLGLTQMNTFVEALGLAEKDLKGRIKEIQALLADLDRLQIRKDGVLEEQLARMDARRREWLDEMQALSSRVAQAERDNQDLVRLTQTLNEVLPILQGNADLWSLAQRASSSELLAQGEQQSEQNLTLVRESQLAQARLEGEHLGHQRALDILVPTSERIDTLPCPICGKPMTGAERRTITLQIQANMQQIHDQISTLRERQGVAAQIQNELQAQVEAARTLRNLIVHTRPQPFSLEGPVAELARTVNDHLHQFQNQVDALKRQLPLLEHELNESEKDRALYLEAQRRLERLGYASPDEAGAALVGLEVRSLSLRASAQAAEETLAAQQTTDLHDIYGQIARVWGVFLGEENWQIQLDADGLPVLQDQQGREFDLSQFSGGEKTALLIILHTIIAHHFSKSDFLLIDEPLEHLDAINRRSLINFLFSTYRHGGFQQAIIATFEETLIRKYMSQDGVHVIHLVF